MEAQEEQQVTMAGAWETGPDTQTPSPHIQISIVPHSYLLGDMKRKEPRVGRYLIYGLLDPRDRCLRYIGKTHKRREIRLAEHIEDAMMGGSRPVHLWIREVISAGIQPEVFVLQHVTPESSWGDAEKQAIERWRNWPEGALPYIHAPQTKKSQEVTIEKVELLNVRAGG